MQEVQDRGTDQSDRQDEEQRPVSPALMFRRYGFVLVLLLLAGAALLVMYLRSSSIEVKPLNEFIELARQREIRDVIIEEDVLTVEMNSGETFLTRKEPRVSIIQTLEDAGVNLQGFDITVQPYTSKLEELGWALVSSVMMISVVLLFLVGYYRFQTEGWEGLYRWTKAKKFQHTGNSINFTDVAGADDAKYEFQEIVDFLKAPRKFTRIGAKVPTGILLSGPTGTGKTMMARATAGEADVPFLFMAGSEFIELYVGVGAKRVRDLFKYAKKNAPCIIFIDEIDAIGGHRSRSTDGYNEREQTLNQILVAMDGFEPNTNIVVMAATNRLDMLDSALLRPGRFDRKIAMQLPDQKGRREILGVHSKDIPLAPGRRYGRHCTADWRVHRGRPRQRGERVRNSGRQRGQGLRHAGRPRRGGR